MDAGGRAASGTGGRGIQEGEAGGEGVAGFIEWHVGLLSLAGMTAGRIPDILKKNIILLRVDSRYILYYTQFKLFAYRGKPMKRCKNPFYYSLNE